MSRAEQAKLWAQRVARWKASGLSGRVFCQRHAISERTLRRWSYRIRDRERTHVAPVSLIPLKLRTDSTARRNVTEPGGSERSDRIELRLHGMRSIVVGAQADERQVLRFIRLLESL